MQQRFLGRTDELRRLTQRWNSGKGELLVATGRDACLPGRLRPRDSIAENIRNTILSDDANLRREPQYLLSQERSVERPTAYLSTLRAIAEGHTHPNDIAMAAGFHSATAITPHLERLRTFRLVERLVPVTADEKGRISKYVLTDLFLAFWFRYVQPTEAALEQGAEDWVLQQRILPDLDTFVSRANGPWERACREFLWRAFRHGLLAETGFDRLGWWWERRGATGNVELDAVGLSGNRVTLVASCKWRNTFTKPGDLYELRQVAHGAGADIATRYVMFSRSGFDPALSEMARTENAWLVSPEQMFDVRLLAE